MYLCWANSLPLSTVIVQQGSSFKSSTIDSASISESLFWRLDANKNLDILSTRPRITPVGCFPITVSPSKSPILDLEPSSEGRWSIDKHPVSFPRYSCLFRLLPLPLHLRYCLISGFSNRFFCIALYIVGTDMSGFILPTICSGDQYFNIMSSIILNNVSSDRSLYFLRLFPLSREYLFCAWWQLYRFLPPLRFISLLTVLLLQPTLHSLISL